MSNPSPVWPVRAATMEDVPLLVAFNRALAAETENKALDVATLTAGVRALLDQPHRGRYFVAHPPDEPGRVVGQIMHTFEWSDWRNGDIWWIQSVYVDPDCRGRGVYRSCAVERVACAGNAVMLRLYVERHNERAQATYRQPALRRRYLVLEQPRAERNAPFNDPTTSWSFLRSSIGWPMVSRCCCTDDAPLVAVNLCIVRDRRTTRRRHRASALAEHLMFEDRHHDDDYFKPLQEAGGSINGTTNCDRTNYYEVVPSEF